MDYKSMQPGDMLAAVEDDAGKWADAFCQINPDGPPQDVMIGWFANAIEHSGDVRHARLAMSPDALADHLEGLMVHRRLLGEIDGLAQPAAAV